MLLRSAIVASAALLCFFLTASPGHATATWYVAGNSTGNGGCSQPATTACTTIGAALSVASSGDTIVCVSTPQPEPLTIAKSITIDCSSARAPFEGGGFVVAADGSHDHVVINVGGGTVRLRGLVIDAGGIDRGIDIVAAAAVYIEDSVISNGSKQGIYDHRAGGRLSLKDVVVSGNAGAGIVAVSATGSTVLDNVTSEKNAYGIAVGTGNNVVIRSSVFSGNTTAGIEGDAGSHIVVRNSTISHNNIGIQGTSTVRIFNNDISFNNTAFSGSTGTMGLNMFSSNGSMGTALGLVPGAPNDIGP